MKPDLLALSRAIGNLPGAPTPRSVMNARDREGMSWVLLPHGDDGRLAWHIDLDDAATGGVLLARLGFGWLLYQRDHDHRWEVSRPDGADKHEGPTLATALARLILARGSWT